MIHSFIIQGNSPDEIRKKLKEQYPACWQDVIGLGAKKKATKIWFGLIKKEVYEETFILKDQPLTPSRARAIDTARRFLEVKKEPLINETKNLKQIEIFPSHNISSNSIKNIDDVRKTLSILEQKDIKNFVSPGNFSFPDKSDKEMIKTELENPEKERWIRLLNGAGVNSSVASDIANLIIEKGSLSKALSHLLKFKGPLTLQNDERKVVFFIGPTGVGKTTSLVKVAADFYRKRIPFKFMTIDTYRIGATAQIESFASIMHAPLNIVHTPDEFKNMLVNGDYKIIFIDTAGRSPKDSKRLKELLGFIQTVPPIFKTEICLVLSATMDVNEMELAARRFSEFPVDNLLVTKTDESEFNGRLLNFLVKIDWPVSYFTTGQDLPDDISIASSDFLSKLILPKEG